MILNIFYSWQIQTDSTYNRNFIKSCIEKAVKEVRKNDPFKNVKFEITDGVRGVPGSPGIADTITDERIPDADIFIADLTIVNRLHPFLEGLLKVFGQSIRPQHNDNVMLEYGIAKNELTTSRIIGVMNSAYGSPNTSIENITFDIRHLRHPIEYSYTKSNQKEEVQKDLVSALKTGIRDVALFALEHNRSRYKPFAVYDEWKQLHPAKQDFVLNEKIAAIQKTIRDSVGKAKTVIRFLGLSGLGKTRIILELFKPIANDENSLLLTSKVLYLDCNTVENYNIYNGVNEIVSSGQDYIIILDNCSSETCRNIIPVIQRDDSKVSLISIDNNPEEHEVNKISKADYLIIERKELTDVVDNIVNDDFPDLSPEDNKKIKEFAQGIPMMAVLLGDSIKQGEKFIGKLDDKFLLEKLLGGQAADNETKTLLRTSSLFNYFGYYDDLTSQFEFIGTNPDITITQNAPHVTLENFRRMIGHYLDRQIFEKKGRFLSMRPFPLAIYLAQEWLETCTSERLVRIIIAIAGLKEPDRTDLSQALSEQMKFLGYNERAVEIVEQITGPNSPFDNAKVLNTELGSRLFRSFVEVNPVAISQNLSRNFLHKTTDELLEVGEGRRNLVWVLEKVCFDKRTFEEGAKVLFKFAVAENESWSNNATGQLLHLFKVLLAGTEADLNARLTIINWALGQKEPRFTELAIMAMGRALNYGHFTRMLGAENQGSKVLKDFEPTFKEIGNYWEQLLKLLAQIIKSQNEYSSLALEQLANSIRGMISAGFASLLIPYLFEIASELKNWDKALNPIKSTMKYEADILGKEGVEQLKSLYRLITKDDFNSRYNRVMIQHLFDFEEDIKAFEDKITQSVYELAKEVALEESAWNDRIPLIFQLNQFNAFLLGKGVFEALANNQQKLLLFSEKSFDYLSDLNRNEYDPSALGGIFILADNGTKQAFKDEVTKRPKLHHLLFYLVSLDSAGYKETDELFKMVDAGEFTVEEFLNFKRNGTYDVEPELYLKFIKRLFNYGSHGYQVGYQLMFQLAYFNDDLKQLFLPYLKESILNIGIVNPNPVRSIDSYQWWETVRLILEKSDDPGFAEIVNHAIIESITYENSYHLENNVQKIYQLLMEKYFDIVWPDISNNLIKIEKDYVKFYGLKHILGSTINSMRVNPGILFFGKIDEIFNWCGEHLPISATRLAEMVPIFATVTEAGKSSWHPIARRLIDQFGNDADVLSHLSSNIGTFGWTGSIVPYLRQQQDIMMEIKDHPFPLVAEWANKYLAHLTREIKNESQRDAEWDLR